jgi:hypothetical protein
MVGRKVFQPCPVVERYVLQRRNMAHVLIIGEDGRSRLAHLRQVGRSCELEVEENPSNVYKLSWRVLGIATMALVSAAGWVAIVAAARHFLH